MRLLISLLLALTALQGRSFAQDPEVPDYDALVAVAQTALDAGRPRDALRFSAVAVATDADRHEAYVVASVALHQAARHVDALGALDNAIERAPAEDRKDLVEMRARLGEATSDAAFEKHLLAGLAALEQNLAALAARELTAAWTLKPERIELAMEAATAWVAAQELGPARELLRRAVATEVDDDVGEEARQLLAFVEPLVRHRYSDLLAGAAALSVANRAQEAADLLMEAALLMPEQPDAYLELAGLSARAEQPDRAVLFLRRAIARGALDRQRILEDPDLRTLADHSGFRTLLVDAFGQQVLALLERDLAREKLDRADLVNSLGMSLVRVPAGRFTLGSPAAEPGRDYRSESQCEVVLSTDIYLGRTEVTQAQWEAVMGTNPSVPQGPDLPVNRVTWLEAAEFCQRLSELEGGLYRLPTEAEWEYACRAGEGAAFAVGADQDVLQRIAWYKGSPGAPDQPQPVGTLEANAWGFADMHGNVYEWVMDRFGPYPSEPQLDPLGPESGTLRVVRGGAFTSQASACRSAHRARYTPAHRGPEIGFRVAREVD